MSDEYTTSKEGSEELKRQIKGQTSDKAQREEIGRADYVQSVDLSKTRLEMMASNGPQSATRQYELHETQAPSKQNAQWARFVLVVRRQFSSDETPGGFQIVVKGHRLREALEKIHKDDRSFSFNQGPIALIQTETMFHSLPGLKEMVAVEETKGPEADEDLLFELRAGLKYIMQDHSLTILALDLLHSRGEMSWDSLWSIFPYGTVVVGRDGLSEEQAYFVRKCYQQCSLAGRYYQLEATYIDFNGHSCGWVKQVYLNINEYEGMKTVLELPYWPLILHPNSSSIKVRLQQVGQYAQSRHGRQLVEYNGQGLNQNRKKFNPHGRIILDPVMARDRRSEHGLHSIVPEIEIVIRGPLDDEQLIFMSTMVYGFCLADKIWGSFSVSKSSYPEWNLEAFQGLELDEEYKSFIFDLVQHHSALDKTGFDDIIRDKGRGLIGLLEGPPGVGKTLTAEAIAEVTRRPLFSLNAGDLGEELAVVHQALKQALELAQTWDAVLLLDEADVFLAARDNSSIYRNAIIAIFLRQLEYYSGIMLLTTNRLATFDRAFESRLHFCIEYPDLSVEKRLRIWERFIERAKASKELEVNIDASGFAELARLELNGRQIKNLVAVSRAVALQRGQPLTMGGIRVAFKLSRVKPFAEEA